MHRGYEPVCAVYAPARDSVSAMYAPARDPVSAMYDAACKGRGPVCAMFTVYDAAGERFGRA